MRDIVWPASGPLWGGGEWKSSEIENSPTTVALDIVAGIDGLQITAEGEVRSYATRVQFDRMWPTFTLRFSRPSGHRTEIDKRQAAIGSLAAVLPLFTLQAYVRGDSLLYACRTKTLELFAYLGAIPKEKWHVFTNPDGVRFVAVYVKALRDAGIHVDVWQPAAASAPFWEPIKPLEPKALPPGEQPALW